MAGDSGSVLARGEEAAAFIAGRKAVGGASLCAKATKLRCGPRHGRSTAEGGGDVRRPSGQWRRLGGAAWPARTHHVARPSTHKRHAQGPRSAAHRPLGSAGLGVCVRPVRRHGDAAGRE
jgi:hypothetical protein